MRLKDLLALPNLRISKKCGFSRTTIIEWKAGRAFPSLVQAAKLVKAGLVSAPQIIAAQKAWCESRKRKKDFLRCPCCRALLRRTNGKQVLIEVDPARVL